MTYLAANIRSTKPYEEYIYPVCSRGTNNSHAGKRHEPRTDRQTSESLPRGAILCRNCLGIITEKDQKISVAGSHHHSFINPNEHVFDIGCFNQALGCFVKYTPVMRHSWFQGYAWCYSHCTSCNQHIGWQFSNREGNVFYGLILNCLHEPH